MKAKQHSTASKGHERPAPGSAKTRSLSKRSLKRRLLRRIAIKLPDALIAETVGFAAQK
jgi:hypothetical protein